MGFYVNCRRDKEGAKITYLTLINIYVGKMFELIKFKVVFTYNSYYN